MFTFIIGLLEALGIVMLADFIAGLVHWAEDAYGTENTPVFGPLLIRANIVHHHLPRYFTRFNWWETSRDAVFVSAGLLIIGICLGVAGWQLWLFALVSANANQVHKWSHRTRAENGPVISFLQDIGLLLSPRQHAVHHTDPKNTYYCPVTNLVNPLLEWVRFWPALEWVIERLTGVRHRHDTSNRGHGPGPAWLEAYRASAVAPGPADASRLGSRLREGCARCIMGGGAVVRAVCPRRSESGAPATGPGPSVLAHKVNITV